MIQPGTETLHGSPRFVTLQEFEVWATQDWLYDMGTENAQLHTRGKLDEEALEAANALLSGDADQLIDELGDFLWTATATAANAGITLDASIRHELRPDQLGEGAISLALVDELALKLMPEGTAEGMASWVKWLGHYVGKAAMQWHHQKSTLNEEAPAQNFSDAWTLLKRLRAYDGLTQSLLITSAIAQRYAGKTLSDVMSHNAEKLSERKLSGAPLTKPVA